MASAASLVGFLNHTAQTQPGAPALVVDGQTLTFEALARSAASVASLLRGAGIARGDRCALLMEGCGEYVATYYGVLAAGGVVVALNTAARTPEILSWLKHSGARFLFLSHRHALAREVLECKPASLSVINVHGGQGGDLDLPEPETTASPLSVPASGSDLAAIIYTSGSTGNPKGVTLSHANLAANVSSILAYLNLTPSDRTVSVLPFHYSYGNSVLHTHLASGACLVIENNLLYPHRVVERMVSSGATGFAGVPSTYALLLNRVALEKYDLSSLKHVTQAGGPMTPALTQRLVAALPNTRVFVMYGQTEASARLTYLPPERLQEKLGTVGIPVRDVTIEIRNEAGGRCDTGVTGEVCARGPNIMVGYWQDDVATRAVLKDGWLATGDLGFLDADGFLHLVARKTEMIKTGAHRVSPNDIEEALAALDGIEESAAVGVPDELLGQVVKVFVVARQGVTVAESDIRRHCQRQLAQYKVPKHVEFIDSLPRGAGGKLQRFRLLERK